mgnify:CR=1 FL=1
MIEFKAHNIIFNLYKNLEKKLHTTFLYEIPLFRKLNNIEEQNNWFTASDNPNLSAFLSTTIVHKNYNGIDAPFGYGQVMQTGYVDTITLLTHYHNYLKDLNLFASDTFDYTEVKAFDDHIEYKNIKSNTIINTFI